MADALLNGSSFRSGGPGAASTPEGHTHAVREALSALVMFTCVGGIVGNSLVVWLLGFCRQRGTVGIYLLHLAVADLLFLLCSVALTVLNSRSPGAQLVHLAVRGAKYLAYVAGLSLLTAASTQPCLSSLFPTWCRVRWRPHLSTLVCAVLWLLALLLTMLALCFHDEAGRPYLRPGSPVDIIFPVVPLAGFTPSMALSSMALCVHVRRSSWPPPRRPPQLYVAILASVLVCLICTLPLGISGFLLYWLDPPQHRETLFEHVTHLSLSVSSSAKPGIYFLLGSRGHPSLWGPLGAVLSQALQEPELAVGAPPSTSTDQVGI